MRATLLNMSTRVLLALLIALSLSIFFGLTLLATSWFYTASTDPIGLRSFLLWASNSLGFETTIAFMAGTFAAILFFFAINALIVRPLKDICRAMVLFASDGTHINLPAFVFSPAEIRNFARIWSEFAVRVEEVHARDTEMSRVKSDFISTAAHQLRTPLTGIRWALEALEKEDITDSQKALVKSAVDKSHDLVGVVGTLLDITSIESGKYKYDYSMQDIEGLVTEVATDFLPLAERAKISLSYAPSGNLPKVRMDRERMKWVLNNLIENALRYTPVGGSVQLSSLAVSGRVIVQVRDTGIGIKDEDRNNIFERFYRAGNAVAKDNQGNGLGLYIARTIVQDHKGELSFETNREGAGTTFTLALPAS